MRRLAAALERSITSALVSKWAAIHRKHWEDRHAHIPRQTSAIMSTINARFIDRLLFALPGIHHGYCSSDKHQMVHQGCNAASSLWARPSGVNRTEVTVPYLEFVRPLSPCRQPRVGFAARRPSIDRDNTRPWMQLQSGSEVRPARRVCVPPTDLQVLAPQVRVSGSVDADMCCVCHRPSHSKRITS